MNLEKHISTLLYSYDCVIAPGFGAFLTHKNSSSLNETSIDPPSKKVGFNGALQKSDGLLIQTYAQSRKLSFEDAQREIENQISFWKIHLNKNDSLILGELGTFTKYPAGNVEFKPNELNYSLESFGLESIRTKFIMQPVPKNNGSNGVWWKVAAMVPILIGGYLYFAQPQPVADFVNEQWSGFVAPIVNTHVVSTETPLITEEVKVIEEMPAAIVENVVSEKIVHAHQVIAGSFRLKSEAEIFEAKLKEEGFANAKFTQKKGSYFYVAFDTFETTDEALAFKRSLPMDYPEAWILSLN
ncbi:HU domain-containing protein [Moheibacter sediminis]|uniref:Sporulation related domain-containing protein n=1 Tax=Moheibacter sediminis TaxID=1434700 RepID=A0A1W1YI89_9FLAO|nr:SPOR domain-containing protein [Moheibacter sediminis]SMC35468.1 Sporulation related domain-containing protein [Moheibacter sediminis]